MATPETEPPKENDAVGDPSDSDDSRMIEKWQGVVSAIDAATREAFPSSPPFDSSPVAFNSYWHGVFTSLHDSVMSDPKIPTFLTDPSVKKFTVTLFDERDALGCPCCLPDVDPNISLQNDTGVTKGDFIRGFNAYMYGESSPKIHEADGTKAAQDVAGALVYATDWMSVGLDEESGGKGVYDQEEPNIVMYCCRPELFKEKAETEDRTH
ncbi:hypothetical protein AK830_g4105 [Neonectria ditissima]|uniref:Uncharacterized protein n=1 Tax=Neonectria ditissima TaxID=78410 RepID=A0A0P7B9R4_9HYPO|nr:hypothetical protein AK830_g4105 [Neonectria ditissima]